MVEYATAECATCHAIRPMNEMREVRVKRLSSVSHGSGRSTRTGNGRSSSFGGGGSARFGNSSSNSQRSHSNSRSHYRVNDVWVCNGCKAPRSDREWGGIGTILVLAFVAFLLWNIWGGASRTAPDPVRDPTAEVADQPLEEGRDDSAVASVSEPQPEQAVGPDAEEAIELSAQPDEVPDGTDLTTVLGSTAVGPRNADQGDEESKRIAEQAEFCSQITDEGRKNAAYMESVGC